MGCATTTFPGVTSDVTVQRDETKARAAVFRQTGNNRGAVLETALTDAFTYSDERAKRRKLEKQIGGEIRALAEMPCFAESRRSLPLLPHADADSRLEQREQSSIHICDYES